MKTIEKLVEAATEIVKKEIPTDPDVRSNLSLINDLGMDSLDFISFLFKIEQEFELKISEEEIDEFDLVNLGNLEKFLEDRAAQ